MRRTPYVTSYCPKHGEFKDAVGSPFGCPQCIREEDAECPFEPKSEEQ